MNIQTDMITYYIKLFVMNLYVYFSFKKISNIKSNSLKRILVILITDIIISIVGTYIEFYINSFLTLVIACVLYGIILGIITRNKIGYAFIVTIISYSICEICLALSVIITYLPYSLIGMENIYLNLVTILVIQFIILFNVYRIRKFKNGFDFLNNKLNNEYVDIVVVNVSFTIVIISCLLGSIYDEITKNLFISLILLGITMFIVIHKTFIMYYKQKLLKDTIKDYEKELKEKDSEIKKLSEERYEISRINHEFYNRQKALEMKVRGFATEASDEIGILDRIDNLNKEYSKSLEEIKGRQKPPQTNIPEIDDMFKYMQSECYENNIEFKLHIEGEIYHLVNEIIPKNKLETLIGDHIRNAIIAINSSESKNRSILVILGIKDKCYELCIYDSGIEFEIETLKRLGLERATTHKETGGSGIGFMTTFETLKECKASLIIEEKHEIRNDDYTKAVKIRFDGKHEYKIQSYRLEQIQKTCKEKRIILEELKKENRKNINTSNINNNSINDNCNNNCKNIRKSKAYNRKRTSRTQLAKNRRKPIL